jgi:ATP-binding cassette, subfamily B, putative efflux pump
VLKDVTLEARVGTVTAIVGATGAGKSTLMSMLLRMYDADVGEVEVNGVDLRSMKVDDIRANTAIALQKNVLFADSIANNIKMGTAAADRAAIVAAAKVACADEFIIDLPKGYDTELGERGSKLSAGQRQRLSIARAIVRDAPILILDEPTASLDAHTEQRVLANLSAWGADRVIFLITHRLSTIRHADQIALLEDGQIVELGHHDDLIGKRQGRYRAFVEAELTGAGTEHE